MFRWFRAIALPPHASLGDVVESPTPIHEGHAPWSSFRLPGDDGDEDRDDAPSEDIGEDRRLAYERLNFSEELVDVGTRFSAGVPHVTMYNGGDNRPLKTSTNYWARQALVYLTPDPVAASYYANGHDGPSLVEVNVTPDLGDGTRLVNVSKKARVRSFLQWYTKKHRKSPHAQVGDETMETWVLIAYGVELTETEGVERRQFDAWKTHLKLHKVGNVANAEKGWADEIIASASQIKEDYSMPSDESTDCLRASLFDVDQRVHKAMFEWIAETYDEPVMGIISKELRCWSCERVCKREHYFHVEAVLNAQKCVISAVRKFRPVFRQPNFAEVAEAGDHKS